MEIPFGFIHTNQGLGLVVERIIAPSGQSETLRDLCQQNKLEEKHIQALKAFFNECREYHLVFGEVNAAGIMYTEVRNNKPEFVLVDGIGDKLFIPLRAMSKTISAHYVRKVESRIKTRFGIDY